MNEKQKARRVQRFAIGLGGGTVLVVGIIAIPYPGPGWLIVFAGLAILAREFPWAARLLKFARGKYDAWNDWVRRQNMVIRSLTLIATAAVVLLTVWLINGYGLVNAWFDLHQPWLNSPFVK
jgi:uncharacterized protein (TIGR02611 family)